MTTQIGEIMIPCRVCHAAPLEDCHSTKDGKRRNPHKRRIRDAAKMSEILDW